MVTIVQDTLKLRQKAGLSRIDVAKATGIKYSQLSRVETLGRSVKVTDGQAQKLATMLGVAVHDLIAATEPEPTIQEAAVEQTPEQVFRAGAHAMLRYLVRRVDDKGRQTVRELVDAGWRAYSLGQRLRS